jgi:CheY-like chemotaxis protein
MTGAKILYIEDTPENLLLVARVLLVEGFEVVGAASAREGIKLAQEINPDLILMDISLPEMDGLTATARMREIEVLSDVPILALTANVMQEDIEKARNAGCDGFIGKPIDVDKLPEQIRKHLRSKGNG